MTTRTPHTLLDSRRRAVWLVLAFFLVGLGAPCVHCLTLGATPGPAAPMASGVAEPMPGGMPADCPLHQAQAQQAAPEPEPAEAPCPKPGDCCLEQGKSTATLDEAIPVPPPAAAAATIASLDAPVLPARLLLPREIGNDRSHAPPAFLAPLRI